MGTKQMETGAENGPFLYMREAWSGDSRDGRLVNGDGFHYLKMNETGKIFDAFEVYENDDGQEVITKLPEMVGVSWLEDLGFEDFETLEKVSESEFDDMVEASKARLK